MAAFRFSIVERSGGARIVGELNLVTAPVLLDWLGRHDPATSIDLSEVTFVDFVGMSTLLDLGVLTDVRLLNPSPAVQRFAEGIGVAALLAS